MATGGLYGNSTTPILSYFTWFVFIQNGSQPATPTGGTWNFQTNVGTPPSGWSNTPIIPTTSVWMSMAVVSSQNSTITWSAPVPWASVIGVFAYPSAGITSSTGASWGTAYTTSGSGTVIPLTTSPSIATPTFTGTITASQNRGAITYGTLTYSDINNVATFQSSQNNYIQMVLQNSSNGTSASTNFNVSNDAGTVTTNFGEFGINSSGFSGTGSFSQAGYTYLASASTDLVIGTYGNNPIHFVLNSGATDAATLTSTGFNGVAIGATTPSTGQFTNLTVTGTAVIPYNEGGTGATTRTVQAKLQESVSVKDFGAVGDGVTDDTTPIQNAINAGSRVFFPRGTYKISGQLSVGSNCCEVYGEGMYTTVLSKAFNGDLMVVPNSGVELRDFGIAGNGATYAGAGILPQGYNACLRMLRIVDTADSCVVFAPSVGTNTGTGTYCVVEDCFLLPTNSSTTYSIRSTGTDDSARPTDRKFLRISGGGAGPDFSGMNLVRMEGSLVTSAKFSANSQKVYLGGGNRFTLGAAFLTIYGVDHVIDGNFFGTTLTDPNSPVLIDSTASNVFFGPNNNLTNGSGFNRSVSQNITKGSANPNTVYSKLVQDTAVLAWLGSTTNPTIGNGGYAYNWEQDGRICNLMLEISVNTTTTVGSGNYSFQLPFKALADAYGSVMVKSSAGVYYPGTFQTIGGGSLGYIFLSAATPNGLFASTSMAIGTNALINAQVSYLIAAS